MKKIVIVAAAMAAITHLCHAAVCTSGTLSDYISLGSTGCSIGSNTLSNFEAISGTTGATEIGLSNVLLSPFGTPTNPGLQTSVTVVSAAGQVQESLFTYQLSGALYNGSTITLMDASETGDGAVTGLENYCGGGNFGIDGVSGCTGMGGALATVDAAQNMDSAGFTAVNLVSVTNDLTIDGGLTGSAMGGTLVDQFSTTSQVPEPVSALLIGLGLAFVAGRSLRLRSIGVVRR